MKPLSILLFLLISANVSAQSSKELQMLRDSRAKEVITMLHTLSEIYKMKTQKYENGVPREMFQYYYQVNLELEKAYRYRLEDQNIWNQVQNYYIQNRNYMMSWQ